MTLIDSSQSAEQKSGSEQPQAIRQRRMDARHCVVIAVFAVIVIACIVVWTYASLERKQMEDRLSLCLASYFHFQNLNGSDGVALHEAYGQWETSRQRKIRYLRLADKDTVLILCESFQEIHAEKDISQHVAKDMGRVFLIVRLNGDDYQFDVCYGHQSWVEAAREWNGRALAYANESGCAMRDTGCDKAVFQEFINGEGESPGKWNRLFSRSPQIGEFTLPPLDKIKASGLLRRNIERLPASFETVARELAEHEHLDWGLIALSPSPESNAIYDGVVISLQEGLNSRFFKYCTKSSFNGNAEKYLFSICNVPYIEFNWFVLGDAGEALMKNLANPLLDYGAISGFTYGMMGVATAYEYLDSGALFVFTRSTGSFKIIRIK